MQQGGPRKRIQLPWGAASSSLTDDAQAEVVFTVWGAWGRVKCHHTSGKDGLSEFLKACVLQLGLRNASEPA